MSITIATISPSEASQRITAQGGRLIDVRTPREFEEIHAANAVNIPLDTLPVAGIEQSGADETIYVICQGGQRSAKACEKLLAAGLGNVISVEGGTRAWTAAGLPVVRGRKMISLERQVRIVAGLLVLTGVGLGLGVHRGFLGISAFVGAGLTFAGITDYCGMAMLLAKMPWNQVSSTSCKSR